MKAKDKSKQPTEKTPEETSEEVIEEAPEEVPKVAKPSDQIPARMFVKKLKEELKGVHLPKHIFDVFQKIVPSVDTEENYRKVWENTFKRQ